MHKFTLYLVLFSSPIVLISEVEAVPSNGTCQSKDYCYNGQAPVGCQCNESCVQFGDCCPDFAAVCRTCARRCNADYNVDLPCQCNSECESFGNCCADKDDVCVSLSTISEALLRVDKSLYGAGNLVDVDFGNTVSGCSGGDSSPNPFISRFDSAINIKPVFKQLIDMFDNYNPNEGSSEDHTAAEQSEENVFLDTVLASPVMQDAYDFLVTNKMYIGTYADFKNKLNEMWFGEYDRGAFHSSSGFEHVFMGELASDKVGGFHGWVHFQYEEAAGNLEYYGNYLHNDFGDGYGGVTNYFYWYGIDKCKGGGFYGTSPALEMAVYTICWLTHPDALCRMSFNGIDFDIQTWVEDGKYIGSAYPIFY